MTTLEASTTCLFHADSDFVEKSPRRVTGKQTSSDSVALSSSQKKFGLQSLNAYTANYGGLRFDGGAPLVDGVHATMECWAYYRTHRSNTSLVGLIGSFNPNTLAENFWLRTDSGGVPQLDYVDSFTNRNTASGTSALPLNQWVHLAATVGPNRCRRLYLNGVMVAARISIAGPALFSNMSVLNTLTIGGRGDSGGYSPDALVDEARYVYGYPIYEQNVATPSAEYPNSGGSDASFAAVSLLLHGNGSDGGTTITDSSNNALVPTQIGTSGNVTTSTAKQRFGTASLRFGGTHALSYSSSALFEAASRDWTIECWVNLDSGVSSGFRHIWQLFGASIDFRANLCWDASNSRFQFYSTSGSGTGGALITTGSLTPTVWAHTALVKEGNAFTLWVDGVPVGSCVTTVFPTGNLGLAVGTQNYSPAATDTFIGYIDDLRVTMGVARYPLNFTPPTSAYSDCPPPDGARSTALFGAYRAALFGAPTTKRCANPVLAKDIYFGGTGKVVGDVAIDDTPDIPVSRKVWLVRMRDAAVIREQWSDPVTGAYAFNYVDMTQKYAVLTFDHTHVFNAAVADNLPAEPM